METDLKTKKYIKILWLTVSTPFILLFLILILTSIGTFGPMPGFDELENPKTNLATEIYSSDQVLIGKFFKENRTVVEFNELSPNVVNALVATEDIRFYEHSAIDIRALMRVMKGVVTGGGEGGGSTITQQLAKNLFPRDTTKYSLRVFKKLNLGTSKFKEWITAVRLERNYTKQEILAMYLNKVDFGSQAFGIKSAARTFFDTTPDSLTIEQAATIIGILKAPSYYNPKFNPKNSTKRRNTVINQIRKYQSELNKLHGYKMHPKSYYDSIKTIPLTLHYNVQSHKRGIARYFREYLRAIMSKEKPEAPKKVKKPESDDKKSKEYQSNYAKYTTYISNYQKYQEDSIQWEDNQLYGWCNKNKKPDGTNYDLYSDGLKIYTTINSKMQVYAEEAVREHMGKYLQPLFYKRHKGREKAPFSYMLSDEQINSIMTTAMKRSERYRFLKNTLKKDSAYISKVFHTRKNMTVFSWRGEIDTIMTPMDSIKYYKFFLHTGVLSLEPQTGYVRAYVGGIDFNHFQFDNVNLSKRQVGSTFKPFVYSMAMEDNLSPCYKVPNIEVTFQMPEGQYPPTYTPKYSPSKMDGEMVTLKYGLSRSLNQISAWIMKKYGPYKIREMAYRTGIKTKLEAVYSLCVGAADLSLSEMVGAYDTYPNKGVHVEPIYVTRIEDKNGNVISKFKAKQNEALNENTAYRMIYLMQGVVNEGTSTSIRYKYGLKNEIAGKTGTTNDNSDGWFIGYVPNLVTGVWVGGEDRGIRFLSSADGQGSSMALPIWGLYMQKVYKDKKLGISEEPFSKPENYDGVTLDCDEYNDDQNNNYTNHNNDVF
jgi:penicillin-binding protein 1A